MGAGGRGVAHLGLQACGARGRQGSAWLMEASCGILGARSLRRPGPPGRTQCQRTGAPFAAAAPQHAARAPPQSFGTRLAQRRLGRTTLRVACRRTCGQGREVRRRCNAAACRGSGSSSNVRRSPPAHVRAGSGSAVGGCSQESQQTPTCKLPQRGGDEAAERKADGERHADEHTCGSGRRRQAGCHGMRSAQRQPTGQDCLYLTHRCRRCRSPPPHPAAARRSANHCRRPIKLNQHQQGKPNRAAPRYLTASRDSYWLVMASTNTRSSASASSTTSRFTMPWRRRGGGGGGGGGGWGRARSEAVGADSSMGECGDRWGALAS